MILCKIEAPVLARAMQDREHFPILHLYLSDFWKEGEGMFVSQISYNKYTEKNEVEFRLSLDDYFCNEDVECDILLQLAETMGHLDDDEKPVISNKIIKTIEL